MSDKHDFVTESKANANPEEPMSSNLVPEKQTHQEESPERNTKSITITRSGREVKIPSRFKHYTMH